MAIVLLGENDIVRDDRQIINENFLALENEIINTPIGATGPQGPPGVQGQPGTNGIQGDPGVNWRGDWDGATFYAKYDGVQWKGSSFLSLVPHNVGLFPDTNPSYWLLIASKGDQGQNYPIYTFVTPPNSLTWLQRSNFTGSLLRDTVSGLHLEAQPTKTWRPITRALPAFVPYTIDVCFYANCYSGSLGGGQGSSGFLGWYDTIGNRMSGFEFGNFGSSSFAAWSNWDLTNYEGGGPGVSYYSKVNGVSFQPIWARIQKNTTSQFIVSMSNDNEIYHQMAIESEVGFLNADSIVFAGNCIDALMPPAITMVSYDPVNLLR